MKNQDEYTHPLIELSREMKGQKVINSVVLESDKSPNKAHLWQSSDDDFWVVMKEDRKFTAFKHFFGEGAVNKARSFAKQFVLKPLEKGAKC